MNRAPMGKRIGRPPSPEEPLQPAPWQAPAIDAQVDEILNALEVRKIDEETRGMFQRWIYRHKYFGGDPKGRIIFVIRAITESEGNEGALIGPVVSAVATCLTPEIMERGLEAIEAFDKIPLLGIFETMRGLDAFDQYELSHHFSIAIRNKLAAILKPAPPAAVKVKPEPKPPRSVTRISEIEKNVALGVQLLALRSNIKSNRLYGQRVREQFDVDTAHAVDCARVARMYAGRPELYRAISWIALIELSSPKMSDAVRRTLEAKIIAGEKVSAPDIRRARGRLRGGSPKRWPIGQQAARMAA